MNKKRLSVVMAGAMLASSVAPVLAAEEVAVTEIQKGSLIAELTDLLWDAPRFSSDKRVAKGLRGQSVYAVAIKGKIDTTISAKTVKDDFVKSDLQEQIQTVVNALSVGEKVELVNLGYRTSEEMKEGEKVELVLSTEATSTYTEAELSNTDGLYKTLEGLLNSTNSDIKARYNAIIKSHGYVAGKGYVITLTDGASQGPNAAASYGSAEIVLKVGSDRLDFSKFISKDDEEKDFATNNIDVFYGFPTLGTSNTDIADKVEKTYKIASDGTTLALSDIFDGVMLTSKGYELLNAAKETRYVVNAKSGKENYKDKNKYIVKSAINGVDEFELEKAINAATADKKGVYTIKVAIADANKVAEEIEKSTDKHWQSVTDNMYNTYYITGTSKAELKKVLAWIDGLDANVEELAGEDRYATAVKIAKEVAKLTGVADNENIVLVNGNSLVDGLAAAPLAKHLAGARKNAPILLTKSNELPTATKKYLSELVDIAENKTVTVNIVGGTGVVSKAVERELRGMNLKVERFGGEDREATSMAVAKEIDSDLESAFVVGAKGEADAMSIAGKAAESKTPIIVSGFGGLSEDTLQDLEGARVNVIGGESVVSAKDYAALKDVTLTLGRVYGEDRKATNAAVINRFYNASFAGPKSVVVAKDNVLIDALTASNLASEQKAPIVLGTKSLSDAQVDAIAKNATTANKVYQVGHGVERNVVKTVAQALGLI